MQKELKWWQVILLIIVIVVGFSVVYVMPDNPLGTRCMDAWCLNGDQPFGP